MAETVSTDERVTQIVSEFSDLPDDVIVMAKTAAFDIAGASEEQLNGYVREIDGAADPALYDHPDIRVRLRSNFAKFLIDSSRASLYLRKKAIYKDPRFQRLDVVRTETIVMRRLRPAITGRLFALRYAERYGYERDEAGNITPTGPFISAHELSLRILQNIT